MGHLNGFLAPSGGNLNKPIFKSSNAREVARGGGGMLNFRIDRRTTEYVGNMQPSNDHECIMIMTVIALTFTKSNFS